MAAENNVVGEVGLVVKPVDTGFDSQLKKIIDRLEKSSTINLEPNINTAPAEAAVSRLAVSSGAVGDSWQQAAVQVAAFTGAVYAAQNAVQGVVNKFAGLFDQLAQAKAGFTSILGSEAAGGQLLDQIREFARVSPFVTQELVNYSQQLLGVGKSADTIIPLLKSVGDIVASVGGDTSNLGRVLFTLTQIQSVGRLAGQDALQLQSALIPITKYLADYLGKTTAQIKKLQEQGSISADTVFAAINAQGDKVKGAMDRATRNIQGARAVLGDSVTILLQNQPVLNQVFDDIYKGILKFSNFLSTPAFTDAFNRFFEQIGKLYDTLKPLGASLAGLAGTGGLQALDTFSSILSALATVLNAIPEPVLKALAIFFSTIGAIKAPLLLLQYVNRIRDVTSGLFGMVAANKAASTSIDQTTAATERATKADERREFQSSKTGRAIQAAGAAAALAGGAIQDGRGGVRDVVGSTIQDAGFGATIGSAFGPIGTGIGAAAGFTTGLISSLISASDKAKKEAEKQAKAVADTYAKAFTDQLGVRFEGQSSIEKPTHELLAEISKFNDDITFQTNGLTQLKEKQKALNDELNNIPNGSDPTGEETSKKRAAFDELGSTIDNVAKSITNYKAKRDALLTDNKFVQNLDQIRDKLAAIGVAGDGIFNVKVDTSSLQGITTFNSITQILGGQTIPQTAEELATFEDNLKSVGLTLDFILNNTPDQIITFAESFKALPDAFKDSTKAANDFNAAIETGKTAGAAFFKPFVDQAKELESEMKSTAALTDAYSKILTANANAGSIAAKKSVNATDLNAAVQQFLASAAVQLQKASASGVDAVTQQADATRFLYGEFKVLQTTLGLTDKEFQKLLTDADLYGTFSATLDKGTSTNIESLDQLSTRLGVTKIKLQEILDLGPINPSSKIVSSKDTDAAIRSIQIIDGTLASLDLTEQQINDLHAKRLVLLGQIQAGTEAITTAMQVQASVSLFQPFLDKANSYINALNTATSLSTAFSAVFSRDTNDPQTQLLKIDTSVETFGNLASTILQRSVQDLQDLSGQFSDTGKVSALAASSTVREFDLLKNTLKLTDEQFNNLLVSSGAFSAYQDALGQSGQVIVGTLDQVAKQLGISDDAARDLFKSLGLITPTTVIAVDKTQLDDAIDSTNTLLSLLSTVPTLTAEQTAAIQKQIADNKKIIDASVSAVNPKETPFDANAKKQDDERIQREADAAKKKAEQDAAEAERLRKQAADELKRWQDTVESATETLTSRIQQAADSVVQASEKWTNTIKERTQFEQAVSVTSATRNANKQIADITEITNDLASLQARGVSQAVLDSLGIDGITDLKQVRKLNNASDADLAALSTAVSKRDQLAVSLAQSQEDARTRANITQAIIDAAKALDIEGIDKATAAQISNQFNITPGVNAEDVAFQILNVLSAGTIHR